MWTWPHCIHNVFSKLWLLMFSFTHQKNSDSLNITYTLWKVFQCPRYHAALPSEFQKPYTPCMSVHSSFVNVKCVSNNSSTQQNRTTPTNAHKWKQNWKVTTVPAHYTITHSITVTGTLPQYKFHINLRFTKYFSLQMTSKRPPYILANLSQNILNTKQMWRESLVNITTYFQKWILLP